jgi:hypothetical protein
MGNLSVCLSHAQVTPVKACASHSEPTFALADHIKLGNELLYQLDGQMPNAKVQGFVGRLKQSSRRTRKMQQAGDSQTKREEVQ